MALALPETYEGGSICLAWLSKTVLAAREIQGGYTSKEDYKDLAYAVVATLSLIFLTITSAKSWTFCFDCWKPSFNLSAELTFKLKREWICYAVITSPNWIGSYGISKHKILEKSRRCRNITYTMGLKNEKDLGCGYICSSSFPGKIPKSSYNYWEAPHVKQHFWYHQHTLTSLIHSLPWCWHPGCLMSSSCFFWKRQCRSSLRQRLLSKFGGKACENFPLKLSTYSNCSDQLGNYWKGC